MSKTLLIMAAGTGGHVMPGLAIADVMQRRGWQVHWLGTTHGMENRLVPPSGIAMTRLDFSGLRGKGLLHTAKGVFKLLAATWQACKLIKQLQPKFNILLKDDKTYPFICVTDEPFPRVFPAPNMGRTKGTFYGPFANLRPLPNAAGIVKGL